MMTSSISGSSPRSPITEDSPQTIDPCREVEIMLANLPKQRLESTGIGIGVGGKDTHVLISERTTSYDQSTSELVRAHIACEKGFVGIPKKKTTVYVPPEKVEETIQKIKQEALAEKTNQRGCVIS